MSQNQEPYDISTLDATELRHECVRLRAERDAAIKSRDRWKALAKGLSDVVEVLKGGGKKS